MSLKSKNWIMFFIFSIFVALVGFGARLINLTKIPIFADEAIYIRWAQVMRAEPTLRFVPLSDGKQPLFMWLVIPFLKIFHDPLFAGRVVSVFAGLGTLIGIGVLSFIIFRSKKAALLSSLLCAFSPFMFFFDRMSLVDSTLTMFGVWFLVLLITSVKYLRLDFAMLAGFALGFSLLTKSPGLFFAMMVPVSIFYAPWESKSKKIVALKLFGLWVVTWAIGYGMYQILRLGPNFQMIASRNLDYVFPFSHIFSNPKDPFIFDIDRAIEWLVVLAPFEVLLMAIVGYFAVVKKLSFKILILLIAFSFPFLVASMYAKVFTARYILYTLPPLFVLAGFVTQINKKIWVPLVMLFLFHAIYIDWLFVSSPVSAPLPESERSGYFVEWSAGWGIKETADYIKAETIKNPADRIIIGTEGYFGTLPDGLQVYLEKVPNVTVIGTGLNFKNIPEQLVAARKAGAKTYFVVNSSRLNSEFKADGLTLIYSFAKPLRKTNTHEYVQSGPQETFYFYQLD